MKVLQYMKLEKLGQIENDAVYMSSGETWGQG